MNATLVHLDYQGATVTFNEDGWFNATAAAEYYGKRLDHYFANGDTTEYIKELCNSDNTRNSGYYGCYIKKRKGKNGGTWLHPDLGVHFARWLDVRFAIWCDRQIRALIAQHHPHFDWRRARSQAASSFKVMADVLKLVREEQGKITASHHYINEARLINGVLSGQFSAIDRERLSESDLSLLAHLEVRNAILIGRCLPYADRKLILKQYVIDMRPTHPTLDAA